MKQTTKPKKFCFTLMPFDSDFEDIYKLGIKQSCEDAGAYCERVDEQIFTESILDRVYNQISKADIIIADMTNRNPNVFYEVGYAHALGKTAILLTQNSEDIPFDLKHYPHIVYNKKISKLKHELTSRIKWFIENEAKSNDKQSIELEIFFKDKNLSQKGVIYEASKGRIPNPVFTIHNTTYKTFSPEEYRIGIITDKNYTHLRTKADVGVGIKTIKLPDGNHLHICEIDDILYPSSYASLDVYLQPAETFKDTDGSLSIYTGKYRGTQEIVIRVFTTAGYRDFYLTVKNE